MGSVLSRLRPPAVVALRFAARLYLWFIGFARFDWRGSLRTSRTLPKPLRVLWLGVPRVAPALALHALCRVMPVHQLRLHAAFSVLFRTFRWLIAPNIVARQVRPLGVVLDTIDFVNHIARSPRPDVGRGRLRAALCNIGRARDARVAAEVHHIAGCALPPPGWLLTREVCPGIQLTRPFAGAGDTTGSAEADMRDRMADATSWCSRRLYVCCCCVIEWVGWWGLAGSNGSRRRRGWTR
jgi:hypothetical protein